MYGEKMQILVPRPSVDTITLVVLFNDRQTVTAVDIEMTRDLAKQLDQEAIGKALAQQIGLVLRANEAQNGSTPVPGDGAATS
jgi:hypothetical protein